MYSVFDYGVMLADPRADLYADALRQSVRPGAVVVDVGTGTGIWSAYACALGARHVYAIEPDDVIGIAIEMARANGLDDRITFLQRESTAVTIDEPADVVVADIRGVLPFAGTSLRTMIDARRFLAPGGVLIPRRDTVWVSVVEAPAAHQATVTPWDARCFGIDFGAARRAAVNMWRKERFAAADLVAPPAQWAELDYGVLVDPSASGRVSLVADRSTVAHGLAVWFESDLTDRVRMSNRPGDPALIYAHAFFPWPSAVAVAAGDVIDVHLRAIASRVEYVFGWETTIAAPRSAGPHARFAQSTFDGLPLSLAMLHAHAAEAVVTPGPDGEVERFILNGFDGAQSQREIASGLVQRFPGRFASQAEALARVTVLGRRMLAGGGQAVLHD